MIHFRVDASLAIGTGHVMRCLTLAEALRAQGIGSRFLCRELPGHLADFVRARGFEVALLPAPHTAEAAATVSHADWLGVDQSVDAAHTLDGLGAAPGGLIVVDHYGLNAGWEEAVRARGVRVFVIDDLADRQHICEMLLDQNVGRRPSDYAGRVPPGCRVLCGPTHALLRPEFAAGRPAALERRARGGLDRVLVAMGGVDAPDATSEALEGLSRSPLSPGCRITVVMGPRAPWLERVREIAGRMPRATTVRTDITDMGREMAEADLAVGAAGGTALERCCVGLPSLLVVLAENQRAGARSLAATGAAQLLGDAGQFASGVPHAVRRWLEPGALAQAARAAASVTDGLGTRRVVESIRSVYGL